MLGNLQQYKDAISSKHLSLAFRKMIVRVCLDECLFYGAETMTLTANHIKQYTSARMFVLRAMRQITRWDQHYHHISGKTMLNENKMATCAEKIRRRTFGFWKKIICEAPVLSPERMLMGRPCIVWEGVAYPPTRNNGYATTTVPYAEIPDGSSDANILLHGSFEQARRIRPKTPDETTAKLRRHASGKDISRTLDANYDRES